MPPANVAPLRPVAKLVPFIPDSDLSRLIAETLTLARAEPTVLEMIDRDRDALARAKKKARIEDREWFQSRGLPLPGFDTSGSDDWSTGIELGTGRPRIPAVLVLIFMVIRGYLGGFKDRKTAMVLVESKTVEIVLASFGITMPGASTIIDNVNAVSPETSERILDAQVRQAIREGFDDFKEITFDSTKVEANSKWPTDSGIIMGLVCRAEHLIRLLSDHGITLRLPAVMATHIKTIKEMNKKIQLSAGKKDSKKKRGKLYRKLLRTARQARKALGEAHERAVVKLAALEVTPSEKRRVTQLVEGIGIDVQDIGQMIINADKRINRDEKVDIQDKVLSLADEDAAMIVKGQDPVVGYRPQLGRSKNGFVTALIVPEGNAADSGQLEPIVESAVRRTGVTPSLLSFDDGYTNTAAREHYKSHGIDVVSFSGSKGRNVIPLAEYESSVYAQARNDRSAVESLMFTLKHNHEFGRVMRRGIESVRTELLEKAIAYNAFRMIKIRLEREREKQAA